MAVLENDVAINKFLFGYLQMLLSDLQDEQLAAQPVAGTNHPLWTLGHLAVSADSCLGRFGSEKTLPETWGKLFGPGSTPTSNPADYPSRQELLAAVEERYATLCALVSGWTQAEAGQANPHPRLKEKLPTVEGLAAFILTGHYGIHLGQLSMWRRTMGLPALF
ncbi:DinB family protein [Planctomicrobium sp. SH664]|uniref:DinB family protein n=1 Tax=Planctomicrobium sp. SH664 TaxID=3448125 RepID=UPI003F5B8F16